jgi:hypothetical protein
MRLAPESDKHPFLPLSALGGLSSLAATRLPPEPYKPPSRLPCSRKRHVWDGLPGPHPFNAPFLSVAIRVGAAC